MCGLLGEVSRQIISEPIFTDLLALSRLRGPDQKGYWSDGLHCQFGFNRLSILDTTINGLQPMHSPSGRYVLMLNGEVYNYKELQSKHGIIDSDLRSTSDAEVLVHLLELVSIDEFASLLNGMFAVVVWDSLKKRLYLIRDFAGIKPLYYGIHPDGIIFASQFDQVFKHPAFNKGKVLKPEVVKEYFGLGYMPSPHTVFKNIYQVNPGEYVIYNPEEGKVSKKIFYNWNLSETHGESDNQTKSDFTEMFGKVVANHLHADVEVATFLSGGIDSPIVTAFASQHRRDIEAFTIGIEDPLQNESDLAEAYADELKVHQVTEFFSSNQLVQKLDAHFRAMPEPFGDYSSLPTYLITHLAKNYAKVMLSGDGGDELFWGYPRFLSQASQAHYFNLPQQYRRPLIRVIRKFSRKKISYGIEAFETLGERTLNFQLQFFNEQLDMLVPETKFTPTLQALYDYKGKVTDKKAVLQWLKQTEFFGHLQRVLRKVDLCSMGNSLEVRVPFLDKHCLEFSNTLKPELGISHHIPKYLLKKVLADFIPEEKILKEKRGFNIPINKYLRNELKDELQTYCLCDKYFGHGIVNSKYARHFVLDFLDNKHQNGWGVWHLYAWQKWAHQHVIDFAA